MAQIGFIGLGHMGAPMVANLIKAGHDVCAYDVDAAAIQHAVSLGAKPADSLAAAAKNADILFTMLQTADQVISCCDADEGIFATLSKDALYVDCSTIGFKDCCLIHNKAQELGLQMLDAPVSGGVKAATAGTLTFMVGGSVAGFNQIQNVLQVMGKKIIHAGQAGNGIIAKLCNNMLLGITMVGVSETFLLAEAMGLDKKMLQEICAESSGQCWVMDNYVPVPGVLPNMPADNSYKPGFAAAMMLKDLLLAQDSARELGVHTQLGSQAQNIYNEYVALGHGDGDFSGVIQMIQKSGEYIDDQEG